ncbi:TetR family transcriptional regulator [Faecalicatena orotica]|uniref:TetR family transcriptional regulator n=1 Tax=Faecalicatena orotica TaxID=1544 RepID=A0A2Y9BJW2_9FIRM|nr:TetR/AcrR family transcriptional regulator [Faecalicatena orotica]PWJ21533.1 TetR family transcriptional regulator [Faecalicatena orotica]SSA58343.1 transcriptional regulator, TetR family [Faecalicatena orotica]
MGKKSDLKQEYILEQAQRVFAQKGFKDVTMKDIVTACNISRGGIYLYFNNTSEIFEAVLKLRAKTEQNLCTGQAEGTLCAEEQMRHFLNAQKRELLNPADSLIIATYEYLFAHSKVLDKAEMQNNFNHAGSQLRRIIQSGVDNGEFSTDPDAAAQNIVLLLEGLRISSTVLTLDEEFLEQQMEYILSQLKGGLLK